MRSKVSKRRLRLSDDCDTTSTHSQTLSVEANAQAYGGAPFLIICYSVSQGGGGTARDGVSRCARIWCQIPKPYRRNGKSGNISTRCSSTKRSGSGVHVFQLAFEHTEGILNKYFSYVWYLYRRTLRQSYVCAVVYSGHLWFGVTSLNLYNYCKRWQILFKFGNLFAII